MIIHISRQRYDFIGSQGYGLRSYEGSALEVEKIRARLLTLPSNDTQYHLLDDEYAFCVDCNEAFDSVDANTPAELETIKNCPERARIALRDMRQENALHYKELCLRSAAHASHK